MTNTYRATKIISDTLGVLTTSAENTAYRLAKAGLLAPEPRIIRTREELAALDPDTVVVDPAVIRHDAAVDGDTWIAREILDWYRDEIRFPMAIVATGDQVRAARQALEAANDLWNLPVHRTEAGYPNCSTCDGGGCPDCTDPA